MRFIGLDNYENINCYFITTLQILHSSQTLTNHILKGDFQRERETMKTLMEPLCIYAEMKGSDADIMRDVKNAMFLKAPLVRDGYNWIVLLNYYYFPILYKVLGQSEFHKVLQEMSIEQRMIFSDVKIENDEILPPKEASELLKYLEDYSKNIHSITSNYKPDKFTWRVTALEMYIGDKYGHVAAIIRGDDNQLYIYDDHNKDTLFDHFIKYHKKQCDKLRLYYFDKQLIELYNKALHVGNNEKGFHINNFSYIFTEFNQYTESKRRQLKGGDIYLIRQENQEITDYDHRYDRIYEIDDEIPNDDTESEQSYENYEKSDDSNQRQKYKYLCLFFAILSFVLILVIVYYILRSKGINIGHMVGNICHCQQNKSNYGYY